LGETPTLRSIHRSPTCPSIEAESVEDRQNRLAVFHVVSSVAVRPAAVE
jgi:hypothetical protein